MPSSSLLEAFEKLSSRRRRGSLNSEERTRWHQLRGEVEGMLFHQKADEAADRREHLRVPVCLRARFWSSDELKDRYVQVLGEGGLFVASDNPLPVGSRVDLEIDLVERCLSFRIQGEVVSVDQRQDLARRGMGIRFVDLTYDQKAVLYALVDDTVRQRLLERRQYARLDSQLQARFLWGGGSFVLNTADLSRDGLFVASEHLLMPGERMKVLLLVPGHPDPVRAVAEVVRVVETPEPGLPSGLGLRYVMMDPQGRSAITDYMVGRVVDRLGPVILDSELRKKPRLKRRLPVQLEWDERLFSSTCRDVSASGIFVQTLEPPAKGSNLLLSLEHPVDKRQVRLSGQVVRVVDPDPSSPHLVAGVGVHYDALEPAQRERLNTFLKEFVLLEN